MPTFILKGEKIYIIFTYFLIFYMHLTGGASAAIIFAFQQITDGQQLAIAAQPGFTGAGVAAYVVWQVVHK